MLFNFGVPLIVGTFNRKLFVGVDEFTYYSKYKNDCQNIHIPNYLSLSVFFLQYRPYCMQEKSAEMYQSGLRIRIQLFTLMWIRIRIKVIRICDHCSTDPSGLHFEPPPSIVSARVPLRLCFELFPLMRIRIQLLKIMRIRIRNPGTNIRTIGDPVDVFPGL
jgi:hypothetical protein